MPTSMRGSERIGRIDCPTAGAATIAHVSGKPSAVDAATVEPAAVAVDLGSGQAWLWSVGDGIRAVPTAGDALGRPEPLVRRGRIVDAGGCASLLNRLLRTVPQGLPAGPVVVACQPVLATAADQDAIRRGVSAAFTIPGGVARPLAGIVTRLVADIARNPRMRRLTAAALARGVVVIGDGATTPELTMRLATNLRVPVRPNTSPRPAALSGAGLPAMAASRHPAAVAA